MTDLFKRTIPLTRGKITVVDADVYEWASKVKWFASPGLSGIWYAVRKVHVSKNKQRTEWLHRLIAGATGNEKTDHRDGDGLNNLRSNLRVCSDAQNSRNRRIPISNTSGAKGVHFNKRSNKYQVYIKAHNRRVHLGYFLSQREAAEAYDTAAIEYYGEFARLNFPYGDYL